ncbi:type II secretion system protein GspD [Fimbriimonas ginsengisoli]|uniref:Type II secretion system protein n=1 Tax=Fimbriimonas ginsengisoli Gsoil 348 TaxID=661478 RepID=A0A068NR02_FIMGI|nr:type II secretion system protein GspD [Fimbriimonas ginsengisoli]AIE84009.1 type II secretion system protein [Fimbriimonas ginsengisoli Gsoil 348]
MNTILAAGILALATQGSGTTVTPIQTGVTAPITLNFSQTDVGQIFRTIGLLSGANIIYSGAEKLPVTLHFVAANADEAVRGTTAAAGLSYRRVGKIYVVAKAEAMRQALTPFAERARIKADGITPDFVKSLQDLLPHATVTGGNSEITVVGIPDDIKLARELITDRPVQAPKEARLAEVVSLGVASAKQVAIVLTELYPDVKTSVLADGQGGGGSIALIGSPAGVAEAKAKAIQLDSITPSAASLPVVEMYDVRYASAVTILAFLQEATPSVQATIAPPTYIPSGVAGRGSLANVSGASVGGASQTSSGPSGGSGIGGGQGPSDSAGGGASGGPGAGGSSTSTAYDRSTRIVLKGRRDDVSNALALLAKVDTKPLQVVIDVRIVDASPTDIEKVGLKYSWQPLQFFDIAPGTDTNTLTHISHTPGVGQIGRLPFNLLAVLDLMVQKTDAKLMANPSMQVMNNEEANFFIGDELSFPISTNGALGSQNVQLEKFNIGIGLNVRPRVNADGNITLRLNPVVQTLTSITNGLPQTASRDAKTVVMVQDGETVVIGGLIRDEDTRTISEVPFLSKLPIVGQLFRHNDRNHRRSNIIVTVTPHIVKDAQDKK